MESVLGPGKKRASVNIPRAAGVTLRMLFTILFTKRREELDLNHRAPSRSTPCTTGSVRPRGRASGAPLDVRRIDLRMIY